MKQFALSCLALGLPFIPLSAQAEDIMTLLARKGDAPQRAAPTTIPYSYTLTLDMKSRDGKDLIEDQAVLRIDPSQPPGARATLITASNPESEPLRDFIKDIEDKDNTMDKQAEGFWCGASKEESLFDGGLEHITVISETDSQAVLRPDIPKLAVLLMQSNDNAEKNGKTMMKKLIKRIEGDITVTKPDLEMTGFSVRMTRPLTMMVVAKLKQMDVTQSCQLAPNGHYRLSRLQMNVQGKAMGARFGQEMDMRVSDLAPLP